MRFTINLATKPYLDRRLVNFCCAASFVILVALLVWLVGVWTGSVASQRHMDKACTALQAKAGSSVVVVSDQDKAALKASAAFYNDIFLRKVFSWPGLLRQVEGALPPGVVVTLLEPDRKGGMVAMEGLASSFAGVQRCLEQLETTGGFTDVLLISHGTVSLWEQAQGVKFALSFRMKQS